METGIWLSSMTPSLRDFAVSLFRGANPLDSKFLLHPHAKVFLQRWKDSQAHCVFVSSWARQMERELQIDVALGEMDERATLGDSDTFEMFEKFILHRLCQNFAERRGSGRPASGNSTASDFLLAARA